MNYVILIYVLARNNVFTNNNHLILLPENHKGSHHISLFLNCEKKMYSVTFLKAAYLNNLKRVLCQEKKLTENQKWKIVARVSSKLYLINKITKH